MKTLLLMIFAAGIAAAATLYATQPTHHPTLERFHPATPAKRAIPLAMATRPPKRPHLVFEGSAKTVIPFKPTQTLLPNIPQNSPKASPPSISQSVPTKKTLDTADSSSSISVPVPDKNTRGSKNPSVTKIPSPPKKTHVDYARLNQELYHAANILERFNQKLLAKTGPTTRPPKNIPQENQP